MSAPPTGILFYEPRAKPLSTIGLIQPGAYYQFYLTGTTTPTNVYADGGLVTPLSQVPGTGGTTAASDGRLVPIYLNPSITYRVQLYSAVNTLLEDTDPFVPQPLPSQATIGQSLYPQTSSETTAGVTPVNYQYPSGTVDRYGTNTTPGTTDMSAAVRMALDSVPANGGRIQFLAGAVYKIPTVVYVPQRYGAGNDGIIIEGNNANIVGAGLGTGTIFQSGTGQFSTVAKGGAPNFGLGNELTTTLHYGDQIKNLSFTNFGIAISQFNCIFGCKLENLLFELGAQAVSVDRCFYQRWENLNAGFQNSGSSCGIIFQLNDNNNDMTFTGCHAVGATSFGTGWQMSNGVEGCAWLGCSAEQCVTGWSNTGEILGSVMSGGYFETNTTAINLGTNILDGFNIDGVFFVSNTTAIAGSASSWINGRLGPCHFDSSGTNLVTLTGANNTCTVELSPQFFSEAQSTATASQVPSNFAIASGVQIEGRRIVFASAVNESAEMICEDLSNVGPPRFAYSGGPVDEGLQTGFWLPFCTQTNSSGSSTFLTQIGFSTNRMVVLFDLVGTITAGGSGNVQLSGIIFAGGASILRSDTNVTYTVTPSNSSSKLLLTVAGSGFSGKTISWQGQIRHV